MLLAENCNHSTPQLREKDWVVREKNHMHIKAITKVNTQLGEFTLCNLLAVLETVQRLLESIHVEQQRASLSRCLIAAPHS